MICQTWVVALVVDQLFRTQEKTPLSDVVHGRIPPLGERFTISLEASKEVSIIRFNNGNHDIYVGDKKAFSLNQEELGIFLSILSGVYSPDREVDK